MGKATRVPLAGTYNSRPGTLTLSGTSGVVGIGIVGLMVVGKANAPSGKDHRLINCFQITELDTNTNTKRLYVVKRPGLPSTMTPASGSIGNAIHVWTGQGTGQKVMSCFGNTDSTLYDSTTSKGTITGKATSITETSISGTPTLTIPSSDSTLWYYQDGGTATKVVSNYPGNAGRTMTGPVSHIDGYALHMDTGGRIHNSDLNAITTWPLNSYVTANSVPDVGVACIRVGSLIVGFCKEHFDVYRNAGNPTGSPLTRVEELSKIVGCISADAITSIRDIVYFAGSTKGANVAIYAYGGGDPQPVSTPEIDAQLAIAGPANISLTTVGCYGRHLILVSAASTTFAYCIEEKGWHEWSSTTRLWYKADGVSVGSAIVNYVISKESTSGKVFVINPSNIVYLDNGVAFTATIQTAKLDMGTMKRKFWNDMFVVGDQETSTSTLNISWYDDDYQTASTARSVDLSGTPYLPRCGSSRRRSWVLSHASNTSMRLEALEFPNIEVGSN